jgi:hypothetical protein
MRECQCGYAIRACVNCHLSDVDTPVGRGSAVTRSRKPCGAGTPGAGGVYPYSGGGRDMLISTYTAVELCEKLFWCYPAHGKKR